MLILGEFASGKELLAAARALREAGHAGLDVHSPYPLPGTAEALGLRPSRIPLVTLVGGLSGAALGYGLQVYANAIDYPINVGGRPPHAAPSFVPITFELGVLLAALSAVLALILFCGLPRLFHPAHLSEAFRSATVDGFWLSAPIDPAAWDPEAIRRELQRLGARTVELVEEP